MCGIAGVVSNTRSHEAIKEFSINEALQKMMRSLRHRGPDDQGKLLLHFPDMELGLAHTRLSIIDLTPSGHQPMEDASTSSCITYNGEIYNYRELRDHLPGIQWQSCSDTEVILKSYQHGGTGCFKEFRGMFSFALWDGLKKELTCIRDPFGIKPLYYYFTPNLFLFASEVRALLASGLVSRTINPDGLASYLEYGSVESPLTIIRDVYALEPGYSLTVACNMGMLKLSKASYNSVLFEGGQACESREEACSVLRKLLERSVQAHLVSDVPVAAFLSGGIDSSAIVGLMSKVSTERPRTVTIVFPEKDFSEERYARLVAKQFETDHNEVSFSESDLLEILPSAFAAMDQPTIDGVNTYVISQAVIEAGLKVALSGLGGDELFGGYPTFRRAEKMRRLNLIPGTIRKALAHAGSSIWNQSVSQRKAWEILAGGADPRNIYKISRQLFNSKEIRDLVCFEGANEPVSGKSINGDTDDFFNVISRCELQGYMSNMLLRDTDFMSMAHGLEVRVPFVDRAVVPFVLSLSGNWKRDGARPKPLLLDALGDLIPAEIWNRPKKGFVFPFHQWMQYGLRRQLNGVFSRAEEFGRIGLNKFASRYWHSFLRNPKKERWSRSWALYVFWKYCELNEVYFS